MVLKGINGKSANVLTGWIKDDATGDFRLITAHIDKEEKKMKLELYEKYKL